MPSTARAASPTPTLRELNRALLARQMLLERQKVRVVDAVERLGCLQGQWAPAPYVALWTRLLGFERGRLTKAIDGGDVIKATLMLASTKKEAVLELLPFKSLRRADKTALIREGEKLVRFYYPESPRHEVRA